MSQELKLALIQSSLIWENPEENKAVFSKKIRSISSDVDVIILPEMFTTGFTMNPEKLDLKEGIRTLEWMKELSKEKEAVLIGSLPFYENSNFTNRLLFVLPNGDYFSYDKRHTFTLAGEDKVYKSGNERLIVTYKDFRICPMVCYDLRFPVWARNTDNYDLLVYVANWPKPRIAAWDVLLKARAIENMTYCVGVNRIGTDAEGHVYSGHSAVYDALGEQIAYSDKEEIIYTSIFKKHVTQVRSKLKFLEDRDTFKIY